MRIAHVGPPLARLGGPAGYLQELQRAAAGRDARGHEVLFPSPAPPKPRAAPMSEPALRRVRAELGRWRRRLLGAPPPSRPPLAELQSPGGRIHETMLLTSRQVMDESAASLDLAASRQADVLFTHDVLVAGQLLDRPAAAPAGIPQVWLLIHAPFPIALYLIWSWGVPELDWREVMAFPDVRAWVDRELAVWRRADRLILPCPEAGEELVRIDPRFAEPLARAEYLLTGASDPVPADANASRAELRARFGLPESEPVGLFLGNAQPYRGLDALLAALPSLPPRGTLPGVLAVAGPAPGSLPASPRLQPLGRVADVGGLLRAVDFVVNVNRFSLFDLSTIEAVAAGKPLLLHETGGNRTFRALGAGCRSLPDLAPGAIAAGLAEMLALTHDERSALGRASRSCYEAHLTPEHLWRRHLDLYDRAEKDSPCLSGTSARS